MPVQVQRRIASYWLPIRHPCESTKKTPGVNIISQRQVEVRDYKLGSWWNADWLVGGGRVVGGTSPFRSPILRPDSSQTMLPYRDDLISACKKASTISSSVAGPLDHQTSFFKEV